MAGAGFKIYCGDLAQEEEEEDLVDPATYIKEHCSDSHCSTTKAKLGRYYRHLCSGAKLHPPLGYLASSVSRVSDYHF